MVRVPGHFARGQPSITSLGISLLKFFSIGLYVSGCKPSAGKSWLLWNG